MNSCNCAVIYDLGVDLLWTCFFFVCLVKEKRKKEENVTRRV